MGDHAGLGRGGAGVVHQQSLGGDAAPLQSFAQQIRLRVAAHHPHQQRPAPQAHHVGGHVARAAEHIGAAGGLHHRHGGFGRNAPYLAPDVFIEHHIAGDEHLFAGKGAQHGGRDLGQYRVPIALKTYGARAGGPARLQVARLVSHRKRARQVQVQVARRAQDELGRGLAARAAGLGCVGAVVSPGQPHTGFFQALHDPPVHAPGLLSGDQPPAECVRDGGMAQPPHLPVSRFWTSTSLPA